MGIWDDLRLTAGTILNRNVSALQTGSNPPNISGLDTAKVSDAARFDGAQKLKEQVDAPHLFNNIGRILTDISKLAVDSAVNDSLKVVTGRIQVNKIAKEGLNDQLSLNNANGSKKPDLAIVVEELQAKMEKMQADLNSTKQQSDILTQCDHRLDHLKEFSTPPPIKVSIPLKNEAKKIMIRSRL